MDLQEFKEQVIKLNTLSTEELSKLYRASNRYQSTDGSEVTEFLMLFPKALVSSMEMAYAIEHLIEWRSMMSTVVDDKGRRVYDDDAKSIDGSSSGAELPEIVNHIDSLQVGDPLPWDRPSRLNGLNGVAHIIAAAKEEYDVDMDYKNGKISDIAERQIVRAVEVELDVLDQDAVIELEDAYLILHWDSAA